MLPQFLYCAFAIGNFSTTGKNARAERIQDDPSEISHIKGLIVDKDPAIGHDGKEASPAEPQTTPLPLLITPIIVLGAYFAIT